MNCRIVLYILALITIILFVVSCVPVAENSQTSPVNTPSGDISYIGYLSNGLSIYTDKENNYVCYILSYVNSSDIECFPIKEK